MFQTIFNILVMLFCFGVLIFVHELGHFLAAKWAGIRTEAFAVGMGPVIVSWRKGIGVRAGSTWPAVEQRVREHFKSSGINIDLRGGDEIEMRKQVYAAMDALGLGETEYSLRWLPIGGFVKMLGQEDANPNYVSDDPRSYNMRPVGKRMVVVSAGVIMNLLLAIGVFVIAFTIGVNFPAPVVGDVIPTLPASRALPENAAALGIETPGLQPGDRVLTIDGENAETFQDLQIASAMARPGDTITLVVERAGVKEPLTFKLTPERDKVSGLLGIGVNSGSSTKLLDEKFDPAGVLKAELERAGALDQGVKPGMTLLSVNGQEVSAYGQVEKIAAASEGQPLVTRWTSESDNGEPGAIVRANLQPMPDFERYQYREFEPDQGILGFVPAVRVAHVEEGSANHGKLQPGDVLAQVADVKYPRYSQLIATLRKHRREDIDVIVLRDGERVPLKCRVNKDGYLLFRAEPALDVLITAQAVSEHQRYRSDDATKLEDLTTPAGRANLYTTGGTRILEVESQPVNDWAEFRAAAMSATRFIIGSGPQV